MSANQDKLATMAPSKFLEFLIDLYDEIVTVKVGLRPGRSEPRAVKKRPKPFPRLNEKRSDWHARRNA